MLPDTIQHLIRTADWAVRAHSQHQMNWRQRHTIYTAFDTTTPSIGTQARIWLAILTAEYVLPIFEATFAEVCFEPPEDDAYAELPRQWITLAHTIVEGRSDPQSIAEYRHMAHTNMGCMQLDYGSLARNMVAAAEAAYRATKEALGIVPFHDLHLYSISPRGFGSYGQIHDTDAVRATEWPDTRLAFLAGDVAAAAAIAFSCNRTSLECDSGKLLTFWGWWLAEAIPTAWAKANEPR